jgi:Ca2+-binding EF-hand superfamily protein
MRTASVVLGVVVLLGGIVFFAMRSGPGAGDPRVVGPRGDASGLPSDADVAALARLHEELARAVPVTARSDQERLADARAWVAANRPGDWAYAGFEAKMLALLDMLADGQQRSALWMLNMSQIEIEMIRALDADGNGWVTDEEQEAFTAAGQTMLVAGEHPYLRDRFDADGDGMVSVEERQAVDDSARLGAASGLLERAQIEEWDTDHDGRLSDGERAAGQAAAGMHMVYRPDGQVEFVEDASGVSADEQAKIRAQVAEAFGEEYLDQMEAQRDSFTAYAVVQSLVAAMRVDDMDAEQLRVKMADGEPPLPNRSGFDPDEDGVLGDDQQAAYNTAMEAYSVESLRWQRGQLGRMVRVQFDHSLREGDTDGDGRLSSEEWERRIDRLLTERDERLFLRGYDLDGSGRVDAGELGTFVDWFRAGSLRADVNYDGAVDARDLQEMAMKFQRQGG